MSELFIIEPTSGGLKTIKEYLSKINATFLTFSSASEVKKTSKRPSLIVLLAEKSIPNMYAQIDELKNSDLRSVPVIIILSMELADSMPKNGMIDGKKVFLSNVDNAEFLGTVGQILGIPVRRSFKILVTLSSPKNNMRYSALSVDFSETGMAFECTTSLLQGETLEVSFINPTKRIRLVFNIEIVRKFSNPSGTSFFYGAQFVRLSAKDKMALRDFLIKKT